MASQNEGMIQLKPNNYSAMWFLLGAALPTALLFILASDRVGEQLSSVSSRGSSNGYLPPSHPKDKEPAPAQQQQEDTDMILLRDPFRRIPVYADMSVSSDDFSSARAPLDNPPNTGLYYMKATNRSIEMLRYWQAARPRFPGVNDQPVFVKIKTELIEKLQVRIEPLDTVYFGGFCEYHDDFDKICTMHADCCIGVDNKVHDLMDVVADWRRYRSMTLEERKNTSANLTWTVPLLCRKSTNWHKPVHP